MLIIIDKKWLITIVEKKAYESVGKYLLNETLSDKKYLDKKITKGKDIYKEWMKFCRTNLIESKLNKISNKELYERYLKFFKYYESFSCANVPPWMFMGDKLHQFLYEKLENIPKDDKENILNILSTPNELSYTRKYEYRFLKILLQFKENATCEISTDNIRQEITNNKEIKKNIKKLIQDYFWIPFDYLGPDVWGEEHILKEIKEHSNLSSKDIKDKIKGIENSLPELNKKQKELIKKYHISYDMQKDLDSLKDVAILQDDKKAYTTEAHYYLKNIYFEIAKRTNHKLEDMYAFLKEDVKEILLKNTNISKEAEKRMTMSVTIIQDEKADLFVGKDALKLLKKYNINLDIDNTTEIKLIKGRPASLGKVQGKVKIILNGSDMIKFREGEIIVAPMTTPDYVPIMKKAVGIITDEGGVTCHAAIVSRELKIPCIIGTNNATQLLKDGDLVEMDGNTGEITIIKD